MNKLRKFVNSISSSSYSRDVPFYLGKENEDANKERYIYLFGKRIDLHTSKVLDPEFLFEFLRQEKVLNCYGDLLLRVINDYQAKGYEFPQDLEIQQCLTTASSFYGVMRKTPKEPARFKLGITALLSIFNPSIIYAVFVHEVAHIFFWRHDKKFYRLVKEICPNYDYLMECLQKGYINGRMGEFNETD